MWWGNAYLDCHDSSFLSVPHSVDCSKCSSPQLILCPHVLRLTQVGLCSETLSLRGVWAKSFSLMHTSFPIVILAMASIPGGLEEGEGEGEGEG